MPGVQVLPSVPGFAKEYPFETAQVYTSYHSAYASSYFPILNAEIVWTKLPAPQYWVNVPPGTDIIAETSMVEVYVGVVVHVAVTVYVGLAVCERVSVCVGVAVAVSDGVVECILVAVYEAVSVYFGTGAVTTLVLHSNNGINNIIAAPKNRNFFIAFPLVLSMSKLYIVQAGFSIARRESK